MGLIIALIFHERKHQGFKCFNSESWPTKTILSGKPKILDSFRTFSALRLVWIIVLVSISNLRTFIPARIGPWNEQYSELKCSSTRGKLICHVRLAERSDFWDLEKNPVHFLCYLKMCVIRKWSNNERISRVQRDFVSCNFCLYLQTRPNLPVCVCSL